MQRTAIHPKFQDYLKAPSTNTKQFTNYIIGYNDHEHWELEVFQERHVQVFTTHPCIIHAFTCLLPDKFSAVPNFAFNVFIGASNFAAYVIKKFKNSSVPKACPHLKTYLLYL